MIRQRFYLPSYDWTVFVYYVVSRYNVDEILENLVSIGCYGETLCDAYRSLAAGKLNSGLTYSNPDTRSALVVFAKTSSAKEFQQSYQHEIGHLKDYIMQAHGISPHGEEMQYLGDEIVEATWDIAKDLLCDNCRNHR